MATPIKLWLDTEADYLEVRFSDEAGFMKETENDAVMERVNAAGSIIGFSVQGLSRFTKGSPLDAKLTA